ncbi:MAG: hypothetical protein HYT83_01335 [Candidatus Levybacteria bacterium]|nr:hypothetical protein [Candidatus Levybacteria bacterium]
MQRILNISLVVSIFILLIVEFLRPITAITQDLGRHLLTGQIILQTKSVPKTNLFSYTYPDFPFINHHWFSEVIYFIVYSLSGFNGLLFLTTLTILIAFSLIFFASLKKNNLIAVAIVSIFSISILFERTDVRPETFSFLFLALFIIILYKNREKPTRLIFILPLIELLWINTHIYFPIGIAVLGIFIIDVIMQRKNLNHQYTSILVVVTICSILIALLNPNGLQQVFYPLTVFNNYGYSIEENQNIFFLWNYSHKPTILFFAITVIFLFLSLIITSKKTKPVDWLLAIFFTFLAASAVRNFPLFVFGIFFPFVYSLSIIVEKINILKKPILKTGILLTLVGIIIFQMIRFYSQKSFGFGIATGAKNGADFFLKNNIKGPIFNNFDIGSYLEYRFYPKEKVFVDGRPESYPADFFQKIYIPIQQDKNLFEKISQKYNFNSIFFSHTDQTPWAESFLQNIIQNNNWKMIYLDDSVVIFIKNNNENKEIIDRFFVAQGKMSDFSSSDITSLLRLANFFNTVGFENQQLNMYQKILSMDPNFCPALNNLSVLLTRKNDPAYSIYLSKYQNQCR